MNRSMLEKWSWIDGTHAMRSQLLDILSDADLAFNPGGQNMTLGALCREMGEIEHSYVQSLKTFQQDWSYHNGEADLENSVARLKAWFQTLDDELKATISAFSDEDLNRTIDRVGYTITREVQIAGHLPAMPSLSRKITTHPHTMNKPT